ncbi:Sucrose-6-phosphate hydrolase [Blattella germanica]|nr:Sucrose-6-phosphate hydrolase [Blattella germanica]
MFLHKVFALTLVMVCSISADQVPRAAPPAYTVEYANQYIEENKDTVIQTYRLNYHFMAPIGWINDPNGFIYYQGEYHLFYQFNPYDTFSQKIHWGHAKTKDLIHWEHLPVALAPDEWYDADGVFSGSAIEKDGKLYVMYTGNSAEGQVQCIAVSEDGIHFEKVPENPVLDANDLPSNAQAPDFRDPKVFKRGDLYYVVLVTKTTDNRGEVLLYQSADLINWEFKSILLEGTSEQGIMWECPDLYQLDGKDVLVLSPIQIPRVGNEYWNIDSVVEFVGTMDWESGKMAVETVKELDHGMDFYATQSLEDQQGRRIVIAWMAMWGRNFPTDTLGHHWAGSMTLPRELHVKDGLLTQVPVAEAFNITQNPVEYFGVYLTDEVREFNQVSGETGLLNIVVNLNVASVFTIDLRANENEKTVLTYNTESQELILDRTSSGITIIGGENPTVYSRIVNVPLVRSRLILQIFLDVSSVEVFVNEGVETMTSTIYPTEATSSAIRFGVQGTAAIDSLSFSSISV